MAVKIVFLCDNLTVDVEDLSQTTFHSFGTVIENPEPSLLPQPRTGKLLANAIQANQGSALKYVDVTNMRDLYGSSPSKNSPSRAVMNMFVCAPRTLIPSQNKNLAGMFHVEILERHPYTTQTFIPLGVGKSEAQHRHYLIIVAPSLDASAQDECFPVPKSTNPKEKLPGRGLPDLNRIKAFIANGSQAVTYGAGTWHAPMVVVGDKPIDFVVVQFSNGVPIEDCQEAEIEGGGRSIMVAVPATSPQHPRAKL
ncbi:ureidoglycolate hydrolase-like protein [Amylocarpus encephaloides]|uniref:Ureidoglycolate hydrolase-like protein n=1 Tax=Amylocarpus encephaloides TaxID=45428 RepID=A0A9P8CBJ5_9HELO|nr:ureidoglycolate hydrolase-like protein [Amylocarpus encephaloides]